MMTDTPPGIDEIQSRPILILERTPYRKLVIHHDWIIDPHLFGGPANVSDVFLEGELGGVHADHEQSLIAVFFRPRSLCAPSKRTRRHIPSMAFKRAVEISQGRGLSGMPACGQNSRAAANASCIASSARSRSPRRRTSVARTRPDSDR